MGLLVRASGLVVEDMNCAVARLQEVDVAGNRARDVAGLGPGGYLLERGDVVFLQPDRDLDRNCPIGCLESDCAMSFAACCGVAFAKPLDLVGCIGQAI